MLAEGGVRRPGNERDWAHSLAVLPELPKYAPLPHAIDVSTSEAVSRHWQVTFVPGGAALESSPAFPTETAAAEYAGRFLPRWAQMRAR